ncbi:hypothetical protein DE146DRAFT_637018 [Phaeosphaeria sp. MPI-PUGE-AT-0046c]|nr:hypothetical protein DE146DRAFT_637018 [Phaeosphaeria sp. MPI-PUGE-AT-0046c]
MFTTLPFFITLLPILTSASPFPNNLFPRYLGTLPGSCPDTNHPLESQWIIGYNQFCSTYLPPSDKQHLIPYNAPLVATFDLGTPSGEIAKWVFKIDSSYANNILESVAVDEQTCKDQFRSHLESDAAGGLGSAYCVVDGTGGDKNGKEEMAGQGIRAKWPRTFLVS